MLAKLAVEADFTAGAWLALWSGPWPAVLTWLGLLTFAHSPAASGCPMSTCPSSRTDVPWRSVITAACPYSPGRPSHLRAVHPRLTVPALCCAGTASLTAA